MNRRLAVTGTLAAACAIAAALVGVSAASGPAASAPRLDEGWTVPGELLVRFRGGASRQRIAAVNDGVGADVLQSFQIVPNLKLVRFADAGRTAAALAAYQADPDVLYAQPNFVYRISKTPDDPFYPQMWNLKNTGQTGGTKDADIDAPEAWNTTTGSSSVAVIDIDTGIDYNHQDLAANARPNTAECNGTALVDDDGNGYADDCHGIDTIAHDSDPLDDNGHGTHTAGTIGAIGDNGVGVTGINWNVTIIACKSHDSAGNGTSASIIECYQYAEIEQAHGLDVVTSNNSYGGCPEACGYDQATYDAIESNMEKGILFVASAGNASSDNDSAPSYPATYFVPNVISVAATNDDDHRAGFSNIGDRTVMLGAPGVGVKSTTPNNTYSNLSGTSMASPHVAGVAALLKASNASLDWRAIRNLILASGDAKASLSGATLTGKRLNAKTAVTCVRKSQFGVLRPLDTQSGQPILIAALNVKCAKPIAKPLKVKITPGGTMLTLLDDGAAPDIAAGDGIYSVNWSPSPCVPGTYKFTFSNGKSAQSNITC
ncbi:MAG TPA: S8 family peptidase [Gaiellaceae bacterium]|nr:S8 family peptidase [Gaiellaceae bacterium]